jgi:hypothetical protein
MMAYGGSTFIDPSFLDLGARWWVVSFMPRLLFPQGKILQYPLDWGLVYLRARPDYGEVNIMDSTWTRTRYTYCVIPALNYL